MLSVTDGTFIDAALGNLPGVGAVATIVILLFRTYWRAEDRDERALDRMAEELAALRTENASLRAFLALYLTGAAAPSKPRETGQE